MINWYCFSDKLVAFKVKTKDETIIIKGHIKYTNNHENQPEGYWIYYEKFDDNFKFGKVNGSWVERKLDAKTMNEAINVAYDDVKWVLNHLVVDYESKYKDYSKLLNAVIKDRQMFSNRYQIMDDEEMETD